MIDNIALAYALVLCIYAVVAWRLARPYKRPSARKGER